MLGNDGTRQLAEITYKDALEQHGCLDMEDLHFEVEFLNGTRRVRTHSHSHVTYQVL